MIGAAGAAGAGANQLFHWDGASISTTTPAREGTLSVFGRSKDAVFSGERDFSGARPPSRSSFARRFDGQVWTALPDLPDLGNFPPSVVALWSSGAGELWAGLSCGGVGGCTSTAAIARFDGSAWSLETLPVTPAPNSAVVISASGPADVWAVLSDWGTAGSCDHATNYVLHYDGQAWSRSRGPEPGCLTALWAGPSEVWIAGWCQNLWQYDGTRWTDVPLPPEPGSNPVCAYPNSVFGTDDDHLWVAGGGGIYRYHPR
jgi:hypothetical protein